MIHSSPVADSIIHYNAKQTSWKFFEIARVFGPKNCKQSLNV
jgi:hypothetical protein